MDPKPAGKISLLQWLTGSQYQPTVEAIRMIKDKAERDAKKALLPAITPSGTFSHRSDQSMLKHSGFICLDIDHKDNSRVANFFDLQSELSKIKQIAYCGLSVSGEGYFVLIPIAYPEKHLLHFLALQTVFASFGIKLDEKCKNLSRLRGYSWDPEAYFNHQAVQFTGLFLPNPKLRTSINPAFQSTYSNDFERVEQLVCQIEQKGIDITADYNYWFAIACNLASTFGENGRHFFHRISQYHPGYNQAECDNKFQQAIRKCGNAGISLGALINQFNRYFIAAK
jgi:hypothetical protein